MAMGMLGANRGSGRSRRSTRRMPMAEINVTPFVDVMLVLLIIFMVTAPLLTAGIPVDLPESRAQAIARKSEEVVVSVTSNGDIFIKDALTPLSELPQVLADIPRTAAGQLPEITLRADTQIAYGKVMAVMGELNRAGFTDIALITQSGAQPRADIAPKAGQGA